jgi:transcriptional regulator with XRE-family HTH domain
MNETFGQRLRRIRKGKKFTQIKLEKKAGVAQRAICNYETGKKLPSLTTLEWLCKALGVTATDLLGF